MWIHIESDPNDDHHKVNSLHLAKFLDSFCQFQAVQDPCFFPLELLWTHLARQLSREANQILHEEAHSSSRRRRNAGKSAGVKVKVDVLGSLEAWSPFLNPCQRSRQTQMFMFQEFSTSVLSLVVMTTKRMQHIPSQKRIKWLKAIDRIGKSSLLRDGLRFLWRSHAS